jgi:hypothetical protein
MIACSDSFGRARRFAVERGESVANQVLDSSTREFGQLPSEEQIEPPTSILRSDPKFPSVEPAIVIHGAESGQYWFRATKQKCSM